MKPMRGYQSEAGPKADVGRKADEAPAAQAEAWPQDFFKKELGKFHVDHPLTNGGRPGGFLQGKRWCRHPRRNQTALERCRQVSNSGLLETRWPPECHWSSSAYCGGGGGLFPASRWSVGRPRQPRMPMPSRLLTMAEAEGASKALRGRQDQRERSKPQKGKLAAQRRRPWAEMAALPGARKKWEALPARRTRKADQAPRNRQRQSS